MKFDFKKAAGAIVPSLVNSWQHAVAGAVLGGLTFDLGNAVTGAIVGGLANTAVELYKVGTGGPSVNLG